MKRTLFYLLIVVVFAGWIGTLVARDPGYVLISYDGATLQTGLWVMLAMLCVLALAIYVFVRLSNTLRGVTGRLKNWGGDRKRLKASQLTTQGLIYFQEGNFERAEKFLLSGAKNHESPAINYIAAAKTADVRGDSEAREAYLRLATSLNSGAQQAVAKASAEMALARGEWQACIDHLAGSKDNLSVLMLKKDALFQLEQWDVLALLIPQLRKLGRDSTLDGLEKQILLHRLGEEALGDQQRLAIFRKGPESLRQDEQVILALCDVIQSEKESESALRNALKKSWRAALVEAYGSLGKETLQLRLKTAEGWQKSHPDEPALQHCLGQLYEASGDRDKAKKAYEKSIENGNTTNASQHLANLLAFDGDFKKSNEYLRLALSE